MKEAQYAQRRRAVYDELQAQLEPLGIAGVFTSIGPKALRAWREQWVPQAGSREAGGWDWEALRISCGDNPRRLEVSMWSPEDVLCGLVLGRASKGGRHVSLEWIEGCVGGHALKGRVLDLADLAGTTFAMELGITLVRIVNPDPALIPRYGLMGYAEVRGQVPGMEKEVHHD